ncbi:MAG: BREX-1 system adenine-specific DNA-methyltransferase PglX, partial [Deltaproteobacteria bacterium]|nr:BREX-1 system adenine-specific DNA-methyltransferase PglX [Deltaproteobacteria bacterium]
EIRREIINHTEIETMAHLGTRTEFDVANKTAQGFSMYAFGKIPGAEIDKASGVYFRLVKENEEEKHTAFCSALRDYMTNRETFSDPHVFILEQEKLKAIPGWPIIYWVSDGIRGLFERGLIDKVAKTCQGIATADNNRFLRLWWEEGLGNINIGVTSHEEADASSHKWFPYMKGGEVKRWYGNQDFCINWRNDGSELYSLTPKSVIRNANYYFTEGATYSFLTVSNLSVRYLPKGFIFDVAGSSIFPKTINLFLMLGILNSKLSTFLIKLINPTVNYQVGDLARIPIPDAAKRPQLVQKVEKKVQECIHLKQKHVITQETSWEFNMPLAWNDGLYNLLHIEKELTILETEISEAIYQLYEIEKADIDQIETEFGALPGTLPQIDDLHDFCLKAIEMLFLEKHVPDEAVRRSEQIIQEEKGKDSETEGESQRGHGRQKRFLTFEEVCLASRFHPETVSAFIAANHLERPEERYELAVAWVSYAIGIVLGRFKPGGKGALGSGMTEEGQVLLNGDLEKLRRLVDDDGIMVLDAGHPDDMPARVEEVLTILLGENACKEIIQVLDGDLRQFLEKEFFIKWHIPQYRKRPVYWLLQSPKKKYGIWLFHEKLNKDSLFRIRKEYVEPKINLLESRIKELQGKRDGAEGREKRAIEKEIGKLIEILDDVREFLKRLNFIIEERGFVPHIDDGVLLNMAPLWELIPSWQKELKKAWEALERGDYDWSCQAMDHWPERVREKCKTNKSYAIAHGLG